MENEKKIKVVLLEPGKLARATEIDASLPECENGGRSDRAVLSL